MLIKQPRELFWPVDLHLSPCNIPQSSGQKHQSRRNVITQTGMQGFGIYLSAKGPNGCKPCQDHSPEQLWQKPSLWEISTWANRFLFMHDTHVVNHWFRTGWTVTHLTIRGFFLLSKPLLLFLHNLPHKRGNLRVMRALRDAVLP